MIVRPAAVGITLDAAQARDLDDAFWVERLESGFRLSVFVAGVAVIVPVGSRDDESAALRGLNLYAPGVPREPMFGPHIASGLASLLPGRERPAVAVVIDFDAEGAETGRTAHLATFTSRAKLAYEDFDHLLDPDGRMPGHSMAAAAFDLASATWRRRVALTGIPDWDAAFDASGRLVPGVGPGQIAQTVVHEFMVAANAAATEIVRSAGAAMIYRNQGARAGGPNGRYELDCLGHAALGKAAYGPFTNPIRRYVDLVNQRILCAVVEGVPSPYAVPDLARICAASNRAAQKAEIAGRRAGESPAPLPSRGADDGTLPVRQPGRPALDRLDSPAFRIQMERALGLDADVNREIARRVDGGLLTHSDAAWLILGTDSPLDEGARSDLLRRLTANPGEMARILSAASNEIGLPDFDAEMRDLGGGRWLAAAALGRHVGDAVDGDPDRARGLALVGLAASVAHLAEPEALPPGSGLRLADDRARERLASLCRLMGWGDPCYEIVDKSSSTRPLHGGTVAVATDHFPYRSPVVHGSTRRSAMTHAAELALPALDYYAEDQLRRNAAAFGADFGRLAQDARELGPEEAIEHFCRLNGASLRHLWLAERPSIRRFECLTEISAGGLRLAVPGEGESREQAMESAAWEAVGSLLGDDTRVLRVARSAAVGDGISMPEPDLIGPAPR